MSWMAVLMIAMTQGWRSALVCLGVNWLNPKATHNLAESILALFKLWSSSIMLSMACMLVSLSRVLNSTSPQLELELVA